MTPTLSIFSHAANYTTARYFESAALKNEKIQVCYLSDPRKLTALTSTDFLLFVDPVEDWPLSLELLPSLRAAYLIDVHQGYSFRSKLADWFDVVFTAQHDYVRRLEEDGHENVYWLPLAGDPDVHFVPGLARDLDVGFVGKLGLRGTRRHQVLTDVLSRFSTNDYRKWYEPADMGRVYSQAKIVFNASINNDINMRVFEALTAGALLVTDRIENGLSALFVEGEHYVGYSSADEAVDKIQYYLSHAGERQRIAKQGQELALSKHTYAHRLIEVLEVMSVKKGCRAALANGYSRKELGSHYADIFVTLRKPNRIISAIQHYGFSGELVLKLLYACGSWLNKRIPVTPNAIKAKLKGWQK